MTSQRVHTHGRSKHRQPAVRLARGAEDDQTVSLHKTARTILDARRRTGGKPLSAREKEMVRGAEGTIALRTADQKKKAARKRAKQSRKTNR